MAGHHKAVGIILGYLRPKVEKRIEGWLNLLFQRLPELRSLLERVDKNEAVGLMSALIELIPGFDTSTFWGKVGDSAKDILESVPREIVRILDNIPAGVMNADTKVLLAGLLKLLDEKVRPRLGEFFSFFDGLQSEDHKKKVHLILRHGDIQQIKIFLDLTPEDRIRFLDNFVELPQLEAAAKTRPLAVVDTIGVVFAWLYDHTARTRQALRDGLDLIQLRMERGRYSRFGRWWLRCGGLSIDEHGRRLP